MKRYALITFALLVPTLIAGCILTTGTIVIVENIDSFASTNNAVNKVEIDLTTNSDYNDHKDQIKSVDAVSIVGWVINRGNAENSGVVWMADSGTLTNPDTTNAKLLVVSPSVPAGDSVLINWSDAVSHVQNFDALKDKIFNDPHFWIYGIASSTPFVMEFRMSLVITLTVGL
jgi:hypothetical protein